MFKGDYQSRLPTFPKELKEQIVNIINQGNITKIFLITIYMFEDFS